MKERRANDSRDSADGELCWRTMVRRAYRQIPRQWRHRARRWQQSSMTEPNMRPHDVGHDQADVADGPLTKRPAPQKRSQG